jgi:hypothetical protein
LISQSRGLGDVYKRQGNGYKEKISLLSYLIAVGIAFYWPIISLAIYIMVALMWFIPDKRIEKMID